MTNHVLKLLLGKNVINLLKPKVAQKGTIILGYFIIQKNNNETPKVAQLVKNHPIWSPWSLMLRQNKHKCLCLALFSA